MQWIKTNTLSNSHFIVLTNRTDPFSDPTAEWFPALTDRTSLNTIQGREWLLGSDFIPFLGSLDHLRLCLLESASCVTQWAETRQFSFKYIYIEKQKDQKPLSPISLLYLLHRDVNYVPVFENEGAIIFERK
jgi:hypothetical protein